VVTEIELVVGRYKPDMLWIADDVFTINHKWLNEYAAEMKRRNMRIPFECISRADRLNDQVIEVMAGLGCYRIWFGSESGSQRVLDAMSRGVTVAEIQDATRRAQRHGIEAGLFVMLGYDGETIEDIDATIDHLKVTQANTFLTTVAYPIKGTAYYSENQDRVEALEPWKDRTERDMRIRGRHSDLFYWFAQRRVTNEVLFHSLNNRKNGRMLDRVSAFAKAKVAHFGMLSTKYSKS
jgi:radical SAM superfamily enzyme YgiQ (UPF0313 family)